jgi:hypothetical protein
MAAEGPRIDTCATDGLAVVWVPILADYAERTGITRAAVETSATTLDQNGRCRSCAAPIAWRHTVGGKRIPLDLAPSAGGNIAVSDHRTAVTLSADEVAAAAADVPRYVSHFATCPDAAKWRKGTDRG